jgi:hypothetical protein
MEATFDNKANVLHAKLRTTHDNSVIYTISTDQTIWGRTYTYVRDHNPVHGGEPTIVGVINWEKKTFEIHGHRKAVKDIRRKANGFRNKYVLFGSFLRFIKYLMTSRFPLRQVKVLEMGRWERRI